MAKLTLRLRMAAYLLILVTVSSYCLYLLGGFNKKLVITPRLASYKNIDDSSQGGATHSWMDYDGKSLLLGCDIKNTARWPFCEIAVSLTDDTNGIDLSHYHSIGLDIDYISPIADERVRVYLRHFDPAYSTIDDPVSLKFNAIEFAPGIGEGVKIIPMQAFQVLSWWIADYEIPVEKSGPQFDNVTVIEIATGSHIKPANYEIRLKSLVFYGEWISEATLLKVNVSLWLMAAIILLCSEHWQLRWNLKSIERRKNQLRQSNRVLYQRSLQYEDLAFKDALTGTKNRNAVAFWLEKSLEESRVSGVPFSLIYLDIDHFKSINDSFGHLKGDEVLKAFAKLLNRHIRENDVFVRWGGEEFIVFCPGEDIIGAEAFARRLSAVVESNHWDDDLPVTCSIGVAELYGNESFESLLRRADSALYSAKNQGRNRVEVKSVAEEVIG